MPNSAQRTEIQRGLQGDQSETFLKFSKDWQVAIDAGLLAAGEVYEEAIKAKLYGGYTSGAFAGEVRYGATGKRFPGGTVANSVKHKKPQYDRNGVRVVLVGSNNFITRMWEFGHRNIFTGKFERVEHWRNAMNEVGPEMAQAFHDVFDAALNGRVEVERVAA